MRLRQALKIYPKRTMGPKTNPKYGYIYNRRQRKECEGVVIRWCKRMNF